MHKESTKSNVKQPMGKTYELSRNCFHRVEVRRNLNADRDWQLEVAATSTQKAIYQLHFIAQGERMKPRPIGSTLMMKFTTSSIA